MNGAVLSQYAGQWIAMLVLLAASGFFSGSETALFSLTRGQLQRLRRGGRAGRLVAALMREPQRTLNTLLLGNMLVNVAYAGIAALIVLDLRASAWVAGVVSLAPLVALILLGEATPKMLAILAAERWSLLAAGPITLARRGLGPLLWCAEHLAVMPLIRLLAPRAGRPRGITTDELGAVLDLSARRGILDRDANELLQEIVELSALRVSDIMVPRVDMIAYDVGGSREGLIDLFRETRLRKIPVYDGYIDAVLGVVHAKRLLMSPEAQLGDLVTKVPFVPETGSVERALLQFRTTRTQMGIVVDEYGGTAGLVTLEDALEEIVGDIRDARDEGAGPAVEQISPQQHVLDGDLAIHEWVDAFEMDLSGRRISTVGGFVTLLLGQIPQVGQQVTYRNLRFTVESMRGRRIGKLRVDLLEAET